jgi:hypothetical protein
MAAIFQVSCNDYPFVKVVAKLSKYNLNQMNVNNIQSVGKILNEINHSYPWVKAFETIEDIEFSSNVEIIMNENTYYNLYAKIHRAIADLIIVVGNSMHYFDPPPNRGATILHYRNKQLKLDFLEFDPIFNASLFSKLGLTIEEEMDEVFKSKGLKVDVPGSFLICWPEKSNYLINTK